MCGLVAAGALAVAGCGNSSPQETGKEYPVCTVSLSEMKLEESYSASVQGRQDIEIFPQVSGRITEVRITEGQKVKKGQVLFVIDQVPYQAAYQSALADWQAAKVGVESAQLDYDSTSRLYENNVVSSYEMQSAANSLSSAKAALAQAEAKKTEAGNNLSYTEVTSPADGVAGTLPYREGSLVSSPIQEPLTTISDNSLMYVYFSMNENTILNLLQQYGNMENTIRNMPELHLRLGNGTIYPYAGHVASISGIISRSTGTVTVRAEFPNPDRLLLSGANGSVLSPVMYEDVIVIPQEATFEIQDKIFVYKVEDGVTRSVQIQVAPQNNGREYIVTDGLVPGDRIVAAGAGLLRDGVRIIEKSEADNSAEEVQP